MDYLHLTYQQVVDEIPYRNLTIMYKDKLRTCTEVMKEVSEQEMGIVFNE